MSNRSKPKQKTPAPQCYQDLTVNQRIGLKEAFVGDPAFENYRAVWLLFGYVKAVNYFLTDDLSELQKNILLGTEGLDIGECLYSLFTVIQKGVPKNGNV